MRVYDVCVCTVAWRGVDRVRILNYSTVSWRSFMYGRDIHNWTGYSRYGRRYTLRACFYINSDENDTNAFLNWIFGRLAGVSVNEWATTKFIFFLLFLYSLEHVVVIMCRLYSHSKIQNLFTHLIRFEHLILNFFARNTLSRACHGKLYYFILKYLAVSTDYARYWIESILEPCNRCFRGAVKISLFVALRHAWNTRNVHTQRTH